MCSIDWVLLGEWFQRIDWAAWGTWAAVVAAIWLPHKQRNDDARKEVVAYIESLQLRISVLKYCLDQFQAAVGWTRHDLVEARQLFGLHDEGIYKNAIKAVDGLYTSNLKSGELVVRLLVAKEACHQCHQLLLDLRHDLLITTRTDYSDAQIMAVGDLVTGIGVIEACIETFQQEINCHRQSKLQSMMAWLMRCWRK